MAAAHARLQLPGLVGSPAVETLHGTDVERLRLGWHNRHQADEIRRLLEVYPGRSVWVPDSREFGLVGPWRHRNELASIVELAAARNLDPVVAALVERCGDHGAVAVLMLEMDERRRPAFYNRVGFEPLEEVVTYELTRRTTGMGEASPLTFVPVTDINEEQMAALLQIDHVAFPWLWWNSPLEFSVYARTPGVELYLGYLEDQPVSYVGLTRYPGWGHLDRIAVHPAYQGRSLGWHSLDFAVQTLKRRGAQRIGLSTQAANVRSQRLYERFGFRRSRGSDYRLYGKVLQEPEGQHIMGRRL